MPGGPRNARQMQMMMRRLGMTTVPLDGVEEVIVRTKQNDHVFKSPEVTVVTVQGVTTYQVVGQPEIRARSGPQSATATSAPPAAPSGPPEEDIALVMEQAGVPPPRRSRPLPRRTANRPRRSSSSSPVGAVVACSPKTDIQECVEGYLVPRVTRPGSCSFAGPRTRADLGTGQRQGRAGGPELRVRASA